MATYGQTLGAILLTADRFGIKVNYLSEAQRLLEKKTVEPLLSAVIEAEARFAKGEICRKNLGREADAVAEKLLMNQ